MPNTVRRPDDDRRRREAQRRRQREEAERREQIRISRDHRQRTTQMERQSLMGPMDLPFLLLTLLLTGVGLVMVFSASFPSAYYETGDGAYYFKRQLIFAVLGLFAMVVMSRINYQRLRGASKLLLGFAVFLLVLVIVPKNPLAITNNNATRWLGTEGFSFQPSEIAKLAVVVYFADSISKKKRKMETWRYGIVPYLAVLGLIAILMMLEPHLSGTILIVGTGIVMMIVGGIQRWLVAAGLGGVGIVAVLYVQLVEKGIIQYGKGRIDTWRDPFNEAWFHGDGWQISQSLIAIGSGGLLGVGLGKSRQKFLYLPEEHNDCIFAVVCEELGLIGACVVMLLFVLLMWLSGEYMTANGGWGLNVLQTADHKMHHTFVEAVSLGILANLMVCLAVWMSYSGRSLMDKAMIMVLPVAMFVASGFEHSIANMFMIPMGIVIRNFASPEFWTAIGSSPESFSHLTIMNFITDNLIPVTIGNIIGGGLLVGLTYWVIYLRGDDHH